MLDRLKDFVGFEAVPAEMRESFGTWADAHTREELSRLLGAADAGTEINMSLKMPAEDAEPYGEDQPTLHFTWENGAESFIQLGIKGSFGTNLFVTGEEWSDLQANEAWTG